MADTKITALTAISTVDPAVDVLPIVDVSDTTMAASGTTKKITSNQILGAGGTATLASATITGDLTVDTSTLKVDTSNNRVGIGTATPALPLDVVGGIQVTSGSAGGLYQLAYGASASSRSWRAWNDVSANGDFQISTSTTRTGSTYSDRYRIDVTGIHEWFNTSGTAMTLNSTGLGVGMSPSAILSVLKSSATQATGLILRNASGADGCSISLDFETSSGTSGSEGALAGRISGRRVGGGTTGALDFFVNNAGTLGTAKMTLDASGNLLVGTTNTNPAYNSVNGIALQPTFLSVSNTSGVAGAFNRNTDGIVLYFTRSGTAVGNVSVTTGGATFNSTSDYRLKESVSPLTGGLARVNALKPSVYKWKSNGSDGEGFLAHELAEVVPAAVNGEKDAVNEDGTIKAQSIDMSRIVPILVAAIKELSSEVNALKNA